MTWLNIKRKIFSDYWLSTPSQKYGALFYHKIPILWYHWCHNFDSVTSQNSHDSEMWKKNNEVPRYMYTTFFWMSTAVYTTVYRDSAKSEEYPEFWLLACWLLVIRTEQNWEHRFNFYQVYRKFPKYSDTQKFCSNHSKIWTMWLYHREICPNDADGMANSVDPDQTAPLGAVWSGSALFAQACLSENLGSLQYSVFCI